MKLFAFAEIPLLHPLLFVFGHLFPVGMIFKLHLFRFPLSIFIILQVNKGVIPAPSPESWMPVAMCANCIHVFPYQIVGTAVGGSFQNFVLFHL